MVSTMKIVGTNSGASGGPPRVRVNRTGRRTYSRQYKLEIIRECSAPGASVAGIALCHRINANLVRRWIVQHRSGRMLLAPHMLPVTLTAAPPASRAEARAAAPTGVIEVELESARILVRGSVDAAVLRALIEALARR